MSTESRKSGRVSIGVNASTSTSKVPLAAPSAVTSPKKMYVDGRRAYGYLTIMSETGPEISHVFGIGKNSVKIGRGSKNDIRMNARMFSRHHATLKITEEGGDLRVELLNESSQKNATRVLPYVLPQGNAVLLDNPSVFLLQGRRFKWVENDRDGTVAENLQRSCNRPIFYISEDIVSDQISGNIVEHLAPKTEEASSQSTDSPSGSSVSSPKKRRSSMNVSLQLRKAAHRHNFRSSLHQVQLGSPAKSILEEETDAESDQRTPNVDVEAEGEGDQSPQQSESVSARTSAAPSRRSCRVSGVENEAVAGDRTASVTLDESTLGISSLYSVAEEKESSMNNSQSQASQNSESAPASPVVEMTPGSKAGTPGRRSARSSSAVQVASSPMNELNQSAASERPLSPDAGPSSPTFVSRSSPSARLSQTVPIETATQTPEKKSKRAAEQLNSYSPRKSMAASGSQRASTASSRRSARVADAESMVDVDMDITEMEMSGASTEGDESRFGLSGLYRSDTGSDSVMNSSKVSLITAAPGSPKVDEVVDGEEMNVSLKSTGRDSRRSMMNRTSGRPSMSKSNLRLPAPVVVSSRASSRISKTTSTSFGEVPVTARSSTAPVNKSLTVSSGANLGDETALGLSALYRTTDQSTAALNDSCVSVAAGDSTAPIPPVEVAAPADSAPLNRRRTYTAMSTGSHLRQAKNADVSLPVTLSRASLRLTKNAPSSLEGAGDVLVSQPSNEVEQKETPKQRESSKWSKGDITIPAELFSTPSASTPNPRLTRTSQVQSMEIAPSSPAKSVKSSQAMDVTIPSNFFSTSSVSSPDASRVTRRSTYTPVKATEEIAVETETPKTLEKLDSSRRVSKRVSVTQTDVSLAGPSISSAADVSTLGISVLYKTTVEENKEKANNTLEAASPELFSGNDSVASRRSSRNSTAAPNASQSMNDSTTENLAGEDVSMPLFDSRASSRLSSNASMEVAAGTPASEKLEKLFDRKSKTNSGSRRTSSRDISIPTEMFSTPLASTPETRTGRKLTSTPVSTSANVTMDSPNLSQLYASPEPRAAGKKSSTRRVTFTSQIASQEKYADAEEDQDTLDPSPLFSPMSAISISNASVGGGEDMNESGEFTTANNTPVASPSTRVTRSRVATPTPAPVVPSPSSSKKPRASVTFDLRKATLKRNLRGSARPVLPAEENDEEDQSLETSCSLPPTPEGPPRALSDAPKRSLTPHPRAKKSTLKSATPLQPVSEDSAVSMAEEDEEEISFSGSMTAFMSPPPPGSPVRRSSRLTITSTPTKESQKETSELATDHASTPAANESAFGLSAMFQTPVQVTGTPQGPSSAKSSAKKGKQATAKKSVSKSTLDITIPEELFRTPTASTSTVVSTSTRSTPVAKTPVVAVVSEEPSVEDVMEVSQHAEESINELSNTPTSSTPQHRLSRKSNHKSPAPPTVPEQNKSAKKNQSMAMNVAIPSEFFSTPVAPSGDARVARKSITTPAKSIEEATEESPKTLEKLDSSRRVSKRASVTQTEVSTNPASTSAGATEPSIPITSVVEDSPTEVEVEEDKSKAKTPKRKSVKATREWKQIEVSADQFQAKAKTTAKTKRAPKAAPLKPPQAATEEPPVAEEETVPAVRSRARKVVPEKPAAAKEATKQTRATRKQKEVVVEVGESNDAGNEGEGEPEQITAAPGPKRVARKKAAPAEEPTVPEKPKGKTARAKKARSPSPKVVPVTEEAPPASSSKPAPRTTRRGKQNEVVEESTEQMNVESGSKTKAPAKPKPPRKAVPAQTTAVEEEQTPTVRSRARRGVPEEVEVTQQAKSTRKRKEVAVEPINVGEGKAEPPPKKTKGRTVRGNIPEEVVEVTPPAQEDVAPVVPPSKKMKGRAARGKVAEEAVEKVVPVASPPQKSTRGRAAGRGKAVEEPPSADVPAASSRSRRGVPEVVAPAMEVSKTARTTRKRKEEALEESHPSTTEEKVVVAPTPKRAPKKKLEAESQAPVPAMEAVPQPEPKGKKAKSAVKQTATEVEPTPKKTRGRAAKVQVPDVDAEVPTVAEEVVAVPASRSRARRGVPEEPAVVTKEVTKPTKTTRKRKEIIVEDNNDAVNEAEPVVAAPPTRRGAKKAKSEAVAVEVVAPVEPKQTRTRKAAQPQPEPEVQEVAVRRTRRGKAGKE